MSDFTIMTEKGINSLYAYSTSHIIGYSSSNYRVERFEFKIPSSTNNQPITKAKLKNISFGSKYLGLISGSNIAASVAITNTYTSWSNSGAYHPGSAGEMSAKISSFTSFGSVEFIDSTTAGTTTTFKPSSNNSYLTPGVYFLYLYTNTTSYTQRYMASNGAIQLNLTFEYESYTKCTAPTEIYISNNNNIKTSKIQVKSTFDGTIKLKWRGALPGSNNIINGYKIKRVYTFNSGGNSTEYEVISSVQEYSFPFNAKSNQIKKITFSIQTLGTAGEGYYSDYSSTVQMIINEPPSAPTIYYACGDNNGIKEDISNISKKDTSSQYDKIYFVTSQDGGTLDKSCSPGTDSDSYAYSIFYSINGIDYYLWENYPQKLSLNLNKQGETYNFYFKTYDDIEYSKNPTIIEIRRLKEITKIIKENQSPENIEYKYYDNSSPDKLESYYIYSNIPLKTIDDNSLTLSYTFQAIKTYSDGSVKSSNTFSYISNLKSILTMENQGYQYYIKIIVSNGIDKKEFTLGEGDELHKIPCISNLKISNQYNEELPAPIIEGSENDGIIYFENKLYFYFLANTRINKIIATYKNKSQESIFSYNDINNNNYIFFEFDSSTINYGEKVEIKINFIDDVGNVIGSTIAENINKIYKFTSINSYNFLSTISKFKPYTYDQSATERLSLYDFINYIKNEENKNFAKYGLLPIYDDNDPEKLKPKISVQISGNNENIYNSWVLRDGENILYINIPYSEINKLFNENDKNKKYQVSFKLSIKNIFGNNFIFNQDDNESEYLLSNTFSLDYTEEPIIEDYLLSSNSIVNKEDFLKEESNLKLALRVKSYNSNPKGQLIIEDEKNFQKASYPFDLIKDKEDYIYTYNKDIIESLSQINKDYTAKFKLTISTDASTTKTSEYTTTFKVKKHTKPYLYINKAEYEKTGQEQTGKVTLSFSNVDYGLDTGLKNKEIHCYYIEEPDSTGEWTEFYSMNIPTDGTTSTWPINQLEINNFSFGGKTSTNIKIKVVTVLYDNQKGCSSIKEYITNKITIYNIIPTISYRHNYIGINTNTFSSEDGIIYISNPSDIRKYIIIKDNNNNVRTIDITTGDMDGFVLDGGTWGET